MKVAENLVNIKEEIKKACDTAGRNPDDIHIIAVTKYVSSERAEEAVLAGIRHLGENREEGLFEKQESLGNQAVWHFIGSLQTKKVKNVINKIAYLHSLDRISLANEIQKRADKPVNCFVQVNVSGEESKHGLVPEQVKEFIKELKDYDKVKVVGLMTMAPFTEDVQLIRNCFKELKHLQTEICSLNLEHAPCTELSMGMSNDYSIAIEEGATFIRIGTALVG